MSARRILEAFDRWRSAQVPLALVTVVETEGSTYTKAGHRILLTGTGDFQGLVSGGCLEGDLADHAREVLASNRAQLLTYDLRDENDELFGLGIGCNGMFRVLLQPMSALARYAPFSAMEHNLLGDRPAVTATVIDSNDRELPAGATLVCGEGEPAAWLTPPAWRERLAAACAARAGDHGPAIVAETLNGNRARVLFAPLRPIPRLLILGAGLDAVPVLDIANRLGWRVTIADHRPASLARGDLQRADQVLQVAPAELSRELQLARYSAAVVMSHHLETDRSYLRALADAPVPYVGLLGPVARRQRLLADLGAAGDKLAPRLRAPVGLRIGADSPESIALAILAEIHGMLSQPAPDAPGGRDRS
jgi:xanthine/CO dehydrogenase XdhC/CoxF family maturation factor